MDSLCRAAAEKAVCDATMQGDNGLLQASFAIDTLAFGSNAADITAMSPANVAMQAYNAAPQAYIRSNRPRLDPM
jgi:hypothetical protein